MQRLRLVEVERRGRGERMDARPPQRLVGVDVPDPRDRALVEEHRLHRRPPSGELLREMLHPVRALERLPPHPRVDVRVCFVGLEEEPGAEAPDVTVRDVRAVV